MYAIHYDTNQYYYGKTRWHKLRRQLNKNDHAYSDQWEIAIGILESRLKNKYAEPINKLLENDSKRGQGFPIVALCCSLIPAYGVGYVTKFAVKTEYLTKFKVENVGGQIHNERWIPAEELDELNSKIVGQIEVTKEFRSQ